MKSTLMFNPKALVKGHCYLFEAPNGDQKIIKLINDTDTFVSFEVVFPDGVPQNLTLSKATYLQYADSCIIKEVENPSQ